MMKKGLLVAVLLGFTASFVANAQEVKIGYINTQEIMMLMPEISDLEKQLADYNAQNAKYLQDMDAEIRTKYDKYEKEKATMSESVRKIQEEELMELQRRLQNAYQTLQAEAEKKQQELLKPVQDKLINAIETVGKKNNFLYIMELQAGILYKSEKAINVGPLVKKELGIE
ncbi:MAG: OmpH family outer membrane protein [Paludibacteraceae bacterium]|nr:OmpH family outer membrane protein [Paludibacteraceae bacterium]